MTGPVKRPKVSACIVVFNEERNIKRCLESVSWADEIVVVDSFSTDRTVEICSEFTSRVYKREWKGYIDQKRYALEQAGHEWVVFVDADERMSPGLIREVQEELAGDSGEWDGYYFPRHVYYLGRWVLHGEWYPDYKLRLFRKRCGSIRGVEPHDRVALEGRTRRLRSPLWHFTYRSIGDQVDRINDFSSISAEVMEDEGTRFSMLALLGRPAAAFIRGYFLRRGFRDGIPGLIVAFSISFGVFVKYAKLWERRHPWARPGEEPGRDDGGPGEAG